MSFSPRAFPAASAAAAPAAAAVEWEAVTAEDGRTYYHNLETDEVSWSLPPSARGEAAWAELHRRLADAEAERAEMEDERAEMKQQLELAQQRQAEQDDIAMQQQEQLKAQLATIKNLKEMNKKLTEELAAIEAAAMPPAEPVSSPPGATRVELEAEQAALQEEQAGLEELIDT